MNCSTDSIHPLIQFNLFSDTPSAADNLALPDPFPEARAFRGLPAGRSDNVVALTPEVTEMLANDCVVAIAISGGKKLLLIRQGQ